VRIPFTRPSLSAAEVRAAARALRNGTTVGNGPICLRVQDRLKELTGAKHVLLTPNATQAFEVGLLAYGIGPGDEVIMPSFAFVSMANAVLSRGAKPVFAEIDPTTLNLDTADVAKRVNERTKMVMPVHYAGVPCDLDGLIALCAEKGLILFEDAAQAIASKHRGKHLGTLGEAGCLSFHETKNVTSGGEGGALFLRDDEVMRRAEIAHEKGTNRSAFLRGEVDKYTWISPGGSYVLSDLQAAILEVQLDRLDELTERRLDTWNTYHEAFAELEQSGLVRRPTIPEGAEHNGHIYFLVADSPERQERILSELKRQGFSATFHFQPLHSSPFAREHLDCANEAMPHTDHACKCIVRLPLFSGLTRKKARMIAQAAIRAAESL
jgi:dTDP-4-amino-4,6-dideoxygalactose transaminase